MDSIAKTVLKLEDVLKKDFTKSTVKKQSVKTKLKKKDASDEQLVPKGKPKSGRVWKSERKKFSSIVKTKGIRLSFEKKQALKQDLKRIKELSNSIKLEKQVQKEARKQRRRDNLKRQEENRKKSEVVQIITNTKKLKNIKKKQLRSIEKRDTTVVRN